MTKIDEAQAKIQAANLRILAASQTENAAAHRRQATHVMLEVLDKICEENVAAHRRQAELLEAQAAKGT